jgi:hypothetical protein
MQENKASGKDLGIESGLHDGNCGFEAEVLSGHPAARVSREYL